MNEDSFLDSYMESYIGGWTGDEDRYYAEDEAEDGYNDHENYDDWDDDTPGDDDSDYPDEVVQPDDWIMDDGDFWRKPRPYKHLGQTGAASRSVSLYAPILYVN